MKRIMKLWTVICLAGLMLLLGGNSLIVAADSADSGEALLNTGSTVAVLKAKHPTRTVYAWFPANYNDWNTSAIDWKAITHLSFRSVTIRPDGSIDEGRTRDQVAELVKIAHTHGVKVTVLVWGGTAAESSAYLANAQDAAVTTLVDYVKDTGIDGINFDDESWTETNTVTGGPNRQLVTEFFTRLHTVLKAANPDYHLSWASPPVISATDRYGEAWPDYAAIADQLDAFTIMSYTMNPPSIGWTTGGQPIRGGGEVTGHARDYQTLIGDYLAATGGKRDKLLLGLWNDYGGYEWDAVTDQPLSPTIGKARRLTPEQARANAEMYSKMIDPLQQVPWYRYKNGTQWVQGWYEDSASFRAKLDLALDQQLGGVCVWVIDGSNEPPETFAALKYFRNKNKDHLR
ncbi:glycosyl hydrolase family 18 protein [Paenibacillus solisilvae]|uniref:Glycosyl hydrolase family 18 protein n=1 Tax=Paenibacillus solisilvae TaxID=2486751 RepID=A0ABW0VV34_9BACL